MCVSQYFEVTTSGGGLFNRESATINKVIATWSLTVGCCCDLALAVTCNRLVIAFPSRAGESRAHDQRINQSSTNQQRIRIAIQWYSCTLIKACKPTVSQPCGKFRMSRRKLCPHGYIGNGRANFGNNTRKTQLNGASRKRLDHWFRWFDRRSKKFSRDDSILI